MQMGGDYKIRLKDRRSHVVVVGKEKTKACTGQGVEQRVFFSAFVVWLSNICNHSDP